LGNAPTAGDLYFNTTTNRLRVYNATTGTWNEGNAGSVAVQNFNGTGSQTAFTLAAAPESENNTQVYISGVYQQKDQYSISGATLTFTSAPPAGTNNIEVVTLNTLPLGVTSADLVQYQPAGAGAALRTVDAKLKEVVSVKDFGAVGDGVTDDTAAIQQSLSTARSVVFPPGTYLVTSTINVGTQRVLKGLYPQANWATNGKSTIFARIADIGDGNPIFQAAATGSTQALTFENLSFQGDKVVDSTNLSAMDATGLVGVNVRGVKQGTQFLNCAFRNLKSAVRDDIGTGNYLDKITFSKCFFTGMYLALRVTPTAGVSIDNCYFDECFDWIDSPNGEVHLNSTRFNNSSTSSETCQIKARTIVADNVYIEGGNSWFQPTQYLSVRGSYFSEAFSANGATKYSCRLVNGNVTLNFEGVRVGTNTRLIDFASGSDASTTTVRLVGNSNGTNFANSASISTYTALGMSVEGYANTQTAWNVVTLKSNYSVPDFGYVNLISDKPTVSADTVDWTVADGRHRRSFYWPSPGSTPQTKTIILRSPSGTSQPGAAVALVTVVQLGDNSGYASRRVKQDRVVWLTESETRSGRSATVTNVFEEFANQSGGSAQTSSTTVTATASVDTNNICTIAVDVANTSLAFGKLLITVDVDVAFD
jgi:hypothetical protein